MKIERDFVPEQTLADFADEHGLVMQVFERGSSTIAMHHIGPSCRFYAHFKHTEVSNGYVLIGQFGNGATEDEAIANYAKEISEKKLVIDACTEHRREIQAPRFIG